VNTSLILFTASWCQPCQAVKAEIEKLPEGNRAGVTVIDIETHPDLANDHGIRSVPTLIVIDDRDTEIARHTTAPACVKAIREYLEEAGR